MVQCVGGRAAPPGGLAARAARPDVPDDRRPARVRGRRAGARGERRGRRRPGPHPAVVGAVVAAAANLGFAFVAHDLGHGAAVPDRRPGPRWPASTRWRSRCSPAGSAESGAWPSASLVGALTIGSALPFLFRSLGALGEADWRPVVAAASVAAIAGGLLALAGVRDGPIRRAGAAVQPEHGRAGLRQRLGPPRQPRLPRAHVGALRDVDLGADVPGGELRRGRVARCRRSPASARSSSSPPAGWAVSRLVSSPIGWAGRP